MAARDAMRRVAGAPVRRLRRALFPHYENVLRDIPLLFESVTAAHKGIADLQVETREIRERLDEALPRLSDGLLEERRLNLRLAELTDLVTELVLPLHDRDIDPKALERLAPDTL
jgi:hypothetical protein